MARKKRGWQTCSPVSAILRCLWQAAGHGSTRWRSTRLPSSTLKQNIKENGLCARVGAACGDCRTLLTGTYDRVVMGHFDALNFLPAVFPHVQAGSVVHVHSVGDVAEAIRGCAEGAGFSASIQVHKVKKFRPHTWHVVQDVILA